MTRLSVLACSECPQYGLHTQNSGPRPRTGLGRKRLRSIREAEIQAFGSRAAGFHLAAKLEVELHITGVALEIVEDHNEALGLVGVEEGQQIHHPLQRSVLPHNADFIPCRARCANGW